MVDLKEYNLPVLTSLKVTLLCCFRASLKLGWTKSRNDPLDVAAIVFDEGLARDEFLASLEPNKLSRRGFDGSETIEKGEILNFVILKLEEFSLRWRCLGASFLKRFSCNLNKKNSSNH